MTFPKHTCSGRGFTLIETLLAVLILSAAIAGPLTIASKGIITTVVAKDQVAANYLAQDAVEYVRFVRDSNRLADDDWLSGLNGIANGHTTINGTSANCVSADGSATCVVDSVQDAVGCTGTSCANLYYDSANGYFTYNTSATKTIFTRTVSLQTPISGNASEASLVVRVSWNDTPGVTRSITVRENIFNWQ